MIALMVVILGLTACSTGQSATSGIDNSVLSTSVFSKASASSVEMNSSAFVADVIPSGTIEAFPDSDIKGAAWQKWKKSVWDAWNTPDNDTVVAYVNDTPIQKRLVLLHNAGVWVVIDDNIERGTLDNEQEKDAFVERYGETFEQSRHQIVLQEIAYQEAIKNGFECSEQDARRLVKEQLESNRSIDPDSYDFALEANGTTEEEYIERYTPLRLKEVVVAQYRRSIISGLSAEKTQDEMDAYFQEHLENLMKNYSIRIVD